MAEYIEREAAIESLPVAYDSAINAIRSVPAADVAPVVHGQWLFDFSLSDSVFYRCSICNRQEVLLEKYSIKEQCPYCHCGARMDGGAGNAAD